MNPKYHWGMRPGQGGYGRTQLSIRLLLLPLYSNPLFARLFSHFQINLEIGSQCSASLLSWDPFENNCSWSCMSHAYKLLLAPWSQNHLALNCLAFVNLTYIISYHFPMHTLSSPKFLNIIFWKCLSISYLYAFFIDSFACWECLPPSWLNISSFWNPIMLFSNICDSLSRYIRLLFPIPLNLGVAMWLALVKVVWEVHLSLLCGNI